MKRRSFIQTLAAIAVMPKVLIPKEKPEDPDVLTVETIQEVIKYFEDRGARRPYYNLICHPHHYEQLQKNRDEWKHLPIKLIKAVNFWK